MRVSLKGRQDGDTLIEVLLSMSLLTAILFTSWGIVNRSSQISLNARKRVTVVTQLKEQAEILKSFYAKDPAAVSSLKFDDFSASPVNLVPSVNPCDDTRALGVANDGQPSSGFHFNSSAVAVTGPKGEKQDSYIWIQAENTPTYVDFYVRSCWYGAGGVDREENAHLIVRLNKV